MANPSCGCGYILLDKRKFSVRGWTRCGFRAKTTCMRTALDVPVSMRQCNTMQKVMPKKRFIILKDRNLKLWHLIPATTFYLSLLWLQGKQHYTVPGMCVCIYLIGQCSTLRDDVALQQKLNKVKLCLKTRCCFDGHPAVSPDGYWLNTAKRIHPEGTMHVWSNFYSRLLRYFTLK